MDSWSGGRAIPSERRRVRYESVVRGSAGSSRDTGSSQLVLLPATTLALVSQLSLALDTEAAWLVSSELDFGGV